jgi:hypothetical protein
MDAETLQYFTNMLQETARKSQLKQSPGRRGSPKGSRVVSEMETFANAPTRNVDTAEPITITQRQEGTIENEGDVFRQGQTNHGIDTVLIPDVSIPGAEDMDAILDEVLASANWPAPTIAGC